jgi:hypothetical protein
LGNLRRVFVLALRLRPDWSGEWAACENDEHGLGIAGTLRHPSRQRARRVRVGLVVFVGRDRGPPTGKFRDV